MDITKGVVGFLASEAVRKQHGFEFAGTGFLAAGGVLITCAHVLDEAMKVGEAYYFRYEGVNTEFAAVVLAESEWFEWDVAVLRPVSLPVGMEELRVWGGDEALDGQGFKYLMGMCRLANLRH